MKKFFKTVKNFIKETDKILLLLCLITSAFGCISVLSATLWTVDSGNFSRDFIVMCIAVAMGIIIALIISLIDYEFIMKMAPLIGLFCIGIMVLTLLVGVGPIERPDAKTWLKIGSTFYFQPSEIVKIGFIITFGVHLEKLKNNINHIFSVAQLLLHALIPIALVIKSGDMGSALVFMIITVSMLFIAGLHWGYFLTGGLSLFAIVPLAWVFVLDNIQKTRFLALINPEKYPDIIYQQERGLTAIGSGGITGLGLFKGPLTQTPNAIPEAENDMIFAVIGEELGLLGCTIALLLLTSIIIRIIRTGRLDRIGNTKVMCYGVAGMIAGQIIINIGMCLMVLPVIGITLPFFSAGGSSNVCIYFSIGLILSFYRYNQQREMIDVRQSNIENPFLDI